MQSNLIVCNQTRCLIIASTIKITISFQLVCFCLAFQRSLSSSQQSIYDDVNDKLFCCKNKNLIKL